MEKFEMGPLQKEWVKELREHPEDQIKNRLGNKEPFGQCCLGRALLCIHKHENEEPIYVDGKLCSPHYIEENEEGDLEDEIESELGEYMKIGLRTSVGSINFNKIPMEDFPPRRNLASLNDHEWTWPQIADFIEKYPEAVFTKSV